MNLYQIDVATLDGPHSREVKARDEQHARDIGRFLGQVLAVTLLAEDV
jgi:hypothetical protein